MATLRLNHRLEGNGMCEMPSGTIARSGSRAFPSTTGEYHLCRRKGTADAWLMAAVQRANGRKPPGRVAE